jgi:hypothetical protein
MRSAFTSILVACLLCGCATYEPKRETVREVWEYGGSGRGFAIGYAKQGAAGFVQWSQITFYDNMTYHHVYYVRPGGFHITEYVFSGEWKGNDSEDIVKQRSTACSIAKHVKVFDSIESIKSRHGQQDESTVPSKAAPSASSDVR